MDEPVAPLQLSQKLDDEIAPRSVKNEATPPSPTPAPEVSSAANANLAADETLPPHDPSSSQLAPPEIDQPLVFDDLDVVIIPAHTSIEDSSSPGTQASVENETQSGKLTVKDALSYLDLVKTTYANQPDVYNQFLDIMKDFRNQNLDTPQVISGVSDLFSSHPTLIKGFNTFLPPGYHIHCTECADGGTDIITTTPSGTTTRHIAPHTPSSSDGPHVNPPSSASAPVGDLPDAMGGLSLAPSDQSNTNNPGDVTHLPQANNSFPTDAELQSAAQFVGKVKLRFSDEPAIFKQFLVSVQEYQTERRPWQELLDQISTLFHEAPDLIEGFKLFLPEPKVSKPSSDHDSTTVVMIESTDPPSLQSNTALQGIDSGALNHNPDAVDKSASDHTTNLDASHELAPLAAGDASTVVITSVADAS